MKVYNLRQENPASVKTAINKYSVSTYSYNQKMPNLIAINDYRYDIGFTNKTQKVIFAKAITKPTGTLADFCFCIFESNGILLLGLTKENPIYQEEAKRQQRRYEHSGLNSFLANHLSKQNARDFTDFSNKHVKAYYNRLESNYQLNCRNGFIPAKSIKTITYNKENHNLVITTKHMSITLKLRKKPVDGVIRNPFYKIKQFKNYYEAYNKGIDFRVLGNPYNLNDDPMSAITPHIIAVKEKHHLSTKSDNILFTNRIYADTTNPLLKKFLKSNIGFILSFENTNLTFIKLFYRDGLIYLSNNIGSIPYDKNIKFYITDPKKNQFFHRHKHSRIIVIEDPHNFKIGFVLKDKASFSYQKKNFNHIISNFSKRSNIHTVSNKTIKSLMTQI